MTSSDEFEWRTRMVNHLDALATAAACDPVATNRLADGVDLMMSRLCAEDPCAAGWLLERSSNEWAQPGPGGAMLAASTGRYVMTGEEDRSAGTAEVIGQNLIPRLSQTLQNHPGIVRDLANLERPGHTPLDDVLGALVRDTDDSRGTGAIASAIASNAAALADAFAAPNPSRDAITLAGRDLGMLLGGTQTALDGARLDEFERIRRHYSLLTSVCTAAGDLGGDVPGASQALSALSHVVSGAQASDIADAQAHSRQVSELLSALPYQIAAQGVQGDTPEARRANLARFEAEYGLWMTMAQSAEANRRVQDLEAR